MKLGIVLSSQPSSFSALPFTEGIAENVAKIKKLGYDGVELAVRDPKQLDVEELLALLEKHRITVPAIATGQVYVEEGLAFVNPDPDIRKKAIERIKSHVRLAKTLDALLIIGLIRGIRTKEMTVEQSDEWLCEALRELAREDPAVKLVIEPINRYETNIINTVGSGLKMLEKVDMRNVGLLLDTFHMNIEEPSMERSIREAGEHIFHFHVADSNRWYPGAGHIDFAKLINTLRELDYKGFVSAEMMPYPDPDTSAIKTIEYMRKLEM